MTFYELRVSRARKFVESSSHNDWESIVCAKDAGHQRAGRRSTELYLDILSKNVADFSRTMLSDIIITEHTLQVLNEAGLTGFRVEPTVIDGVPAGISLSSLPKLLEFVVTGQGGPAHEASGIVKLWECHTCGLVRYSAFERGIVINESTYDGSDFFTISEYSKYVMVSNRAKAIIEKARLSNVDFIESSSLEWSQGVLKPK